MADLGPSPTTGTSPPTGTSPAAAERAADLLWRHWQEGTRLPALPEPCRPRSRAEGYAVQALLERRTRAPLFGWKIAATSRAGQRHIGVDGPLAGRLLRERAFEGGARIPLGRNLMQVAEAEFAFRMARDLPPREEPYGVPEVLSAVESLHPAIEVPDSRFDDFTRVGAAQLIADDACAHYFALGGPAPPRWRQLDLAQAPVRATVAGQAVGDGAGSEVLGDPRTALAWLANELRQLGLTLRAGQVVTTGTCVVPVAVAPGDRVRADFGPLGAVEVTFGT